MPIQQITGTITKQELIHLYNEAVAFVAELEDMNVALEEANVDAVRRIELRDLAVSNESQVGINIRSNLQVLDNIMVDNATLTLDNGVKLNIRDASLKSVIQLARTGLGIVGSLEDTTSYDLILVDHGPQKIQCIKVIRAITGLGLRDAKALVDSVGAVREGSNGTPYSALRGCSFEEVVSGVEKLTEIGANAEYHPIGNSSASCYRDLEQERQRRDEIEESVATNINNQPF